ncbi:hypothetical protein RSAG8_09161, partial [Rhizoctonia solani AG-8 WAC10335]
MVPSSLVDATGLIIKVALKNTWDKPLKFFNDPRSILSNTETTIFDISARSCKPVFTGPAAAPTTAPSANGMPYLLAATIIKNFRSWKPQYYLVRNANTYLAAPPSGQSDRHYTTWFGEFDQSRHSTVQAHFSNIGEKATKFTYDCRACESKFGEAKEIYLCKKFWGAPWAGRGSKAGVIIRALSHFPENGGTTDYHITSEEVLELAVRDPKGAVLNADNHRYFAEETYLDYSKQQSSTEGQGHRKQSDGEQPDVTSSASSSAAGGPSTSRHPRRLASRD